MRRILTYVSSIFLVAFLWTFLTSPLALAAPANWSGNDITLDGDTYKARQSDGSAKPPVPRGETYYENVEITNAFTGGGRASIIYFDSGVNRDTATSAEFVVYETNSNAELGDEVESATIDITARQAANQATSTDARWSGTNIIYDGDTYEGQGSGAKIANGANGLTLPNGAKYYEYIGPANLSGNGRSQIIYFNASDDPLTETSAQYIEFDVTSDGEYSNGSTARTISLTTAADSTAAGDDAASSCDVDGIGWVVCPVSSFLATGMDNIFEMLKGFLEVKPLIGGDNSLFRAWDVMRGFANVAFVIAFLIIIYSQLTSIGLSNYGIKKLLPRLIIAAVLVNISYYICALAVDLSNVLGDSLQQLFIILRENLTAPNANSLASWESVTGFILAGGTAAAAAAAGLAVAVTTTGASAGAAIILLLPMLLALLLAVLVALVVLAARQAVITILIIISPLAFVAYLLPNTEKWFEKWRSTFMTLLIFFPLFSVIFGGSQLAAFLIIQGTDQINIILLGMFVQVAPLVLTPLLVKFSGSLVGRIAGMVNNPNKGLLDRTKKWSREHADHLAARNLARADPVRRRQVFRRFALGSDQNKRVRDAHKKLYTDQADARWANSADFSDIDQGIRQAGDFKQVGEAQSELRYEASKSIAGAVRDLDVQVRDVKLRLENAKLDADINWERNHDPLVVEQRLRSKVSKDTIAALHSTHDAEYEEFKAGRAGTFPTTAGVAQMLAQTEDDTRRISLNAMRNASAKRMQLEKLTDELIDNTMRMDGTRLQSYAGGIQGSSGSSRALAQALSDQHKARADTIANANAIIEHSNLDAAETLQIAKNVSIKGIIVTDDIREAAIKRVASNGVIPHIDELLRSVDLTPAGNEDHRVTLVEALRNNSNRPKFIGQGLMDQLTQGLPGGVNQATIDNWIEKMLIDGKLSAGELAKQDKDTIQRVNDAIDRIPRTPTFNTALAGLKTEIKDLRRNAQLWNVAGERKGVIEDIDKKI